MSSATSTIPLWQQAMARYIGTLKTPRERELFEKVFMPNATMQDFLQSVNMDFGPSSSPQDSRWRKGLDRSISTIQQLVPVFDTVSQINGMLGSSIWAPLKLIFLVLKNYKDTLDDLTRVVDELKMGVERYKMYERSFGQDDSVPAVKIILESMYFDIIKLCAACIRLQAKNKARLFAHISTSGFRTECQTTIQSLRLHVEEIPMTVAAAEIEKAKVHRESQKRYQADQIESQIEQKLDEFLGGADFDRHHLKLQQDLVHGTALWLITHPKFEEWRTSDNTHLFFLHGKPGSGKSFMVSRIVKELQSQNANVIYSLRSSMQGRRENDSAGASNESLITQDPTTIVKSYLTQLMRMSDKAKIYIHGAILPLLNDGKTPSFSNIWTTMVSAINKFENPVFLVLDALDEVMDCSTLLENMVRALASAPKIRIMVSARLKDTFVRELSSVCTGFEKYPQEAASQFEISDASITLSTTDDLHDQISNMHSSPSAGVQLQITSELIQGDIAKFIQSKISSSRKLNRPRVRKLQDEITQELNQNCNGMFLWARLMLEELEIAPTITDIKEQLQNLPRDLTKLYEQIFDRKCSTLSNADYKVFHNIMKWLISCPLPMKVNQLCTAIALKPSHPTFSEDDLLESPEEDILRSCAPIVEILDDGTVQIIHLTVEEYFSQRKPSAQMQRSTRSENFTLETADVDIARVLLTYLHDPSFAIGEIVGTECGSFKQSLLKKLRATYGIYSLAELAMQSLHIYCSNLTSQDLDIIGKSLYEFTRSDNFLTYVLFLSQFTLLDYYLQVESQFSAWTKHIEGTMVPRDALRSGLAGLLQKEEELLGKNHENTLHTMTALAEISGLMHERKEEYRLYQSILERRWQTFEPDTELSTIDLENLPKNSLSIALMRDYCEVARCRSLLGPLYTATEMFEVLRRVVLEPQNPEHPLFRLVANYWSAHVRDCGQREQREQVAEAHFRLYQHDLKVYGELNCLTIMSASTLGMCYGFCNRLEEAEEYTTHAYNAALRALGQSDAIAWICYKALALNDKVSSRFSQAAKKYMESMELASELFGLGHPNCSMCLYESTSLQLAYGLKPIPEIVTDLETGITQSRSFSGRSNDPLTVMLLTNLASAYEKLGKTEEALEVGNQLCDAYLDTAGPDSMELIQTNDFVARILSGLPDRRGEAEEKYLATAASAEINYGKHPTITIYLMYCYAAYILARQERFDEAAIIVRDVLCRCENNSQFPRTDTKILLALVCMGLEQWQEAEGYLRPVHADLLKTLPEYNRRALEVKGYIGACCLKSQKFEEAAECFSFVYHELEKIVAPEDEEIVRTLKLMILAYTKLGKNAEALKLREKLLGAIEEYTPVNIAHPDVMMNMELLQKSFPLLGRTVEAYELAAEMATTVLLDEE